MEIGDADGPVRLKCLDDALEITQTATGIFVRLPYSEISTAINASEVIVCGRGKQYVLRCANEGARNKLFYLISALGQQSSACCYII